MKPSQKTCRWKERISFFGLKKDMSLGDGAVLVPRRRSVWLYVSVDNVLAPEGTSGPSQTIRFAASGHVWTKIRRVLFFSQRRDVPIPCTGVPP